MANLVYSSWQICFLEDGKYSYQSMANSLLSCHGNFLIFKIVTILLEIFKNNIKWKILRWHVLLIISPLLTWQIYLNFHDNFLTFIAMASFIIYLPCQIYLFIKMVNLPNYPRQYLTFIAMEIFTIYLTFY
ncbi:hypothetical protein VPH35_013486 [Triticum aestivum]